MKTFILATTATIFASVASAGKLVYVAPDITMIEEATAMSDSDNWIIPLILLAILVFAVSSSENCDPQQDNCVTPD